MIQPRYCEAFAYGLHHGCSPAAGCMKGVEHQEHQHLVLHHKPPQIVRVNQQKMVDSIEANSCNSELKRRAPPHTVGEEEEKKKCVP